MREFFEVINEYPTTFLLCLFIIVLAGEISEE